MDRREALKMSVLASIGLAAAGKANAQPACAGDGTPAQFIPKTAADPQPQVDDIAKYPKCPYCGMDRKQFHHSRMVVHYGDDLADGTCSLHCSAVSLSLNIDRDPKALWVGDNAADGDVKPLVEVEKASFLVGSKLPGVMTARSKVAYGNVDAAKASQAANGGEIVDFDQALLAAYTDMSADVTRIRKNRAERRRKMMEQQNKG
ncbi:nitrous oxide reductase accessory protein NosL [Thauera sp.]|uniref:nitrous oxide reductase accessory protein NosL n=1 Tax=Thauera sp. TaxID=1905334 RepID=UPI002A35936B|nr:nitrous oxide reductase accessory protein NosL [Thauera sp.]MDX9884065.1 nitrous oxide reductase accessory protein NosL [Thauera sp.]